VRSLTLIDHDRFERSNASRQLAFGGDIGRFKSQTVAANIAPHLIAGGMIVAIALPFEMATEQCVLPADLLIVLVDNNACRWEAARLAREWHIPAVFSMLSGDSMRMQTFLQGPHSEDACLWCALPNLARDSVAPCASAVIASRFASGAQSLFFTYRALMGWPDGVTVFNWRSMDLSGIAPEEIGYVPRRADCALCGQAVGAI
jgi:molybdopterin/thiamine biosynthesis adenylyltransferase